jgi:hypothetical protein
MSAYKTTIDILVYPQSTPWPKRYAPYQLNGKIAMLLGSNLSEDDRAVLNMLGIRFKHTESLSAVSLLHNIKSNVYSI